MKRPRAAFHALFAACGVAALAATTCTEFSRPAEDRCGNLVQEGDEDCDLPAGVEEGGFLCADAECRWECNAAGACPAGYVCEVEAPDAAARVCRRPKSTFIEVEPDLATAVSSAPAFTRVGGLLVADLDGAAPSELVIQAGDAVDLEDPGSAQDSAFVAWFNEEGQALRLERERAGMKHATPVVSSRRAPGGPADSLFVAPDLRVPSVVPLTGSSTGAVSPGLAPQWGGLTTAARFTPSFRQNESVTSDVTALIDGRVGAVGAGGFTFGTPPQRIAAPFFFSFDLQLDEGLTVAPHQAAGEVDESGGERLFVAVRGDDRNDSHVRIYALQGILLTFETLRLPPRAQIAPEGGVWVGKLDGDEFLDVLVSLTRLGADDVVDTYISYGLGDGKFTSNKTLPAADGAFQATPFIYGTFPLAVGRIDGDERADFVFAQSRIALSAAEDGAVALSDCPNIQGDAAYLCGRHGAEPDATKSSDWVEAVIADVNGDGRQDVLAAGAEPRLEVFLTSYGATEKALLRRHTLTTSGPPRTLTATDLDADLVNDIAFHVADGSTATLFASFGTTSGGPEAPVKVLETGAILDLASFSAGLTLLSLDEGTEVGWSALYTSTDRELISPFTVPCLQYPDETPAELTVPQQLAVGHFSAGGGVDAALLHANCFGPLSEGDRLLLLRGTERGGLITPFEEWFNLLACDGKPLQTCAHTQDVFTPAGLDLPTPVGWSKKAYLLPIDLENDGVDELLLLGPEAGGGRILVARADGGDVPRFTIESEPVPFPLGGPYDAPRGSATAADVDGDGFQDVVVLTAATAEHPAELVVIRNDGAGRLDFATALRIPLEGDVTRAIAVVDFDLDGVKSDLFLAGTTGVRLAKLDVVAGTLVETRSLTDVPAAHLAAADFDGDNLVDFAISSGDDLASPRVVRVFRAEAKNP